MNGKWIRAIELLLSGHSVNETAQIVGVNRRTLTNWRRHPEFRRIEAEMRREQWAALVGRLHRLSEAAVDALGAVLRDSPNGALRVRAADVVLSRLATISQVGELERRLSELEDELSRLQEANDEGAA